MSSNLTLTAKGWASPLPSANKFIYLREDENAGHCNFMKDLEKKLSNKDDDSPQREVAQLKELYSEVVGKDKRNLEEDEKEADTLIATLVSMILEGLLRKDMTLEEVLVVLRRRQQELLDEAREVARAKREIDPAGELD